MTRTHVSFLPKISAISLYDSSAKTFKIKTSRYGSSRICRYLCIRNAVSLSESFSSKLLMSQFLHCQNHQFSFAYADILNIHFWQWHKAMLRTCTFVVAFVMFKCFKKSFGSQFLCKGPLFLQRLIRNP